MTRRRRKCGWQNFILGLGLCASAWLFSACGGDDDPTEGCATADVYTANMVRAGTAALAQVRLVVSEPGPPEKYDNTWTVDILDAHDGLVDGAEIAVTTWMPEHSHSGGKVAVVTPQGNGRYVVAPVHLHMAGFWEITFSVKLPGGVMDEVVFGFCIEG